MDGEIIVNYGNAEELTAGIGPNTGGCDAIGWYSNFWELDDDHFTDVTRSALRDNVAVLLGEPTDHEYTREVEAEDGPLRLTRRRGVQALLGVLTNSRGVAEADHESSTVWVEGA